MSREIVDALKIIDERHKLSISWLAEFQETHEGQAPIGLIIRCIDSRLYRIMNTDSISRVLGKVLEYKTMGNTIDPKNIKDRAVITYFLKNLDASLEKHGVGRGFIIVEGHSDCGAVRLIHETPPVLLTEPMTSVLKPIYVATKYVFDVFKEDPNRIMSVVEGIVSESALAVKTDIRKKFHPEIFYDKNVVRILRKQINPARASMALHFYLCIINAVIQVFNMLMLDMVKRYTIDGKIDFLVSLYDIFSARTFYFVVDGQAIISELGHLLREPLQLSGIDIAEYFRVI